jgi:hypothetical protein
VTDAKITRSHVTIALFKGVVYSDSDAALWQALLASASDIREYVAVLGLELAIDEAEGYAYLREQARIEGEEELPRLVPRRSLSYPQSLLLALLRKRLLELDTRGGDTRLVITRDEIVDMVKLFFAGGTNEAKFVDLVDQHINRIVELGFLRRMRGRDDAFEVRRILKAFVDAQWLTALDAKLAAYRAHAGAAPTSEDTP